MKMRKLETEAGACHTRSVLECGSPLPLLTRDQDSIALQCANTPVQCKVWRLKLALLFCFIILHSSFCLRVLGQQYSIDWYKIAGGGGTSTGGVYAVSGTIGQPDAGGPMIGGNYSLTGGFWALISVVQTPGLPDLIITHAVNSVIVSWPDTGSYTLQQNANLASANGWATSGYTVNTANGTNSITVINPAGNLFFRLAK